MANQRSMYRPLKAKKTSSTKAKDSTEATPAATPAH